MKAMILAGGFGTRLRPLTFSIPKPLLPVGERPIIQIIIGQLKDAGIDEIVLATGYHAELIRAFCGDGSKFGVRISYIHEDKPLGTAGPLTLARHLLGDGEMFLLMNGDIITKLDFADFLEQGRRSGYELMVGYTKHIYQSPFGVLAITDGIVEGITEKPSYEYPVSAGIYAIRSSALDLVPLDRFFTVPDLMQAIMAAGKQVGTYFIRDCWIGVESVDDFAEALRQVVLVPADAVPA
jgi:NDP-mannose synthase